MMFQVFPVIADQSLPQQMVTLHLLTKNVVSSFSKVSQYQEEL